VICCFRPAVGDLGMTFLPDPPHAWTDTHAAWNEGRYDQWAPNKGVTTMTFHTRKDLPYQYALVDAFTICDNYHCSLMGPTDPNRYHMWTILTVNREPDRLMDIFREDVRTDRLPQVSWIVAPEAYCEDPNWEPDFGSWYVSQVVDILSSNPDVWSKMVLFITYDEEGGFFDHLVPPTPPPTPMLGRSTVEITNEIFSGDPDHPAGPYGLGIRVPMIVVSPWSRGGWVNSQLFDHTSLIRFLETSG
jgi:phospholipase C